MATRNLNRVQLIGNLTRDPELRYTAQGTAVCTFGLATNRSWTTDTGEKREETEFHRIVAWNKLAEICAQLCTKGRKVYVEGRLSTRTFTTQDGNQRTITEVVIDDMILLDSRRPVAEAPAEETAPEPAEEKGEETGPSEAPPLGVTVSPLLQDQGKKKKKAQGQKEAEEESPDLVKINPEDIPF